MALVRICFGSPFSSKVVVCGHCLVTLSLTINETLKWFSLLPILMQESFWWWQCGDRYIIYLSPPPPYPLLPALILDWVLINLSMVHGVMAKPRLTAYLGGIHCPKKRRCRCCPAFSSAWGCCRHSLPCHPQTAGCATWWWRRTKSSHKGGGEQSHHMKVKEN